MAKKDEQTATDQTLTTPTADAATAQYQYVGDVISSQAIGGQTVTLHPGKVVTLPSGDKVVARLVAQKLLAPYTLRNERHA